jgi:hypothetical protein
VDILGVLAGDDGQAYHGVLVDTDQAAGLADTATLLQVLQDGEGLVRGELAAVQRGALTLGEAFLAGAAGQDAKCFVGPHAEADAQVVAAALAVVGALGVLAAEGLQVIHGVTNQSPVRRKDGQPLPLP